MYYTVVFNSVHYGNEVELQIALDYIKYRAKRAEKDGLSWKAALVEANTGIVAYETGND